MKATHREHKTRVGYQEVLLQPGQFVFGRRIAHEETGLSEREVRTCVNSLKIDQAIDVKSAKTHSVITICNWKRYQDDENESDQQATNGTTNKRPTGDQQATTIQEGKEWKEEKDNRGFSSSPTKSYSHKTFQKPTVEEVRDYCEERKNSVDPETFWNFYESKGWIIGKAKMKSWKACVHTWEKNERRSFGGGQTPPRDARKCAKCGSPWTQGQIECLQCGTRFK